LYHSTLGLTVIEKEKKVDLENKVLRIARLQRPDLTKKEQVGKTETKIFALGRYM